MVGGPAGRVEGGAPGTVVDVVGGEAGVMVAPGCGACEPGGGNTPLVVVVADPRPGDGTVEVVLAPDEALTRAMGQLAGLLGHW